MATTIEVLLVFAVGENKKVMLPAKLIPTRTGILILVDSHNHAVRLHASTSFSKMEQTSPKYKMETNSLAVVGKQH